MSCKEVIVLMSADFVIGLQIDFFFSYLHSLWHVLLFYCALILFTFIFLFSLSLSLF